MENEPNRGVPFYLLFKDFRVIIPDIIAFIIASERHSSESGGSTGSVKTPAEQNDLIARVLESSCSSGKCPAHQSNPEIDIESRERSDNITWLQLVSDRDRSWDW